MTAMLTLNGVTKVFGGVIANDGISIAVPEGAIVGLIGPNGSGKTTLFNAITGTHAIDSGSIHFKDKDADPGSNDARMAAIGDGNLDWDRIIPACRAAGVKWCCIEQDRCYDRDPFDCLKSSFEFLRDK